MADERTPPPSRGDDVEGGEPTKGGDRILDAAVDHPRFEGTTASDLRLLTALADLVDDAVLLLDDDETIAAANAAANRLFAGQPLVGRTLADAVGDYRVLLAVRTARSRGERVERRLDDPHRGTALVVRVARCGRGEEERTLVVLHDETRLRRLETVRRDFVANVSHELRTPIAAIQLLVETLREGALADPEAAADFVARIGREVGHMAQMVEELLELSAIESGRRPMALSRFPAQELLPAMERLRPLADERQLEVTITVDPATPELVGDVTQLGQVLRNLVHNAIKFTPPRGRIRVTLAPAAGDTVELRVADTGPGIAPGDLDRIFERFWKSDRSRQRDGEGTGLGLAIVRHVVEAHRGRVVVESTPGAGATFRVFLPAAASGWHGKPESLVADAATGSRHDDIPDDPVPSA